MISPKIIPFYFKVAWRQKKLFIGVTILGPTTMLLADYVMPLFIAWVLNHIQSGTITLQNSWWIIVLYAITEIYCQVFAWHLNLKLMWKMQIHGAIYLYQLAYKKLTQHSIDFYANTFSGSLVSNVNRFASAFMDFWNTYTFTLILIITSLFATIIGLTFFIWQYALILLVLAIIFIICAYFGTRYIRARYVQRSEAYADISGKLSDSIGNILTVKAEAREFGEETILNASLANLQQKEADTRNSFIKATSIYGAVTSLIRISVLIASIWAVQTGIADAAIIYISLTYTFNLISQLWNVSSLLRSYYQITGDSTKMLDIIETSPAIVDRSQRRLKVTKSNIVFDDVSFTHPATESDKEESVNTETLFKHFSLAIKNRQKIGLVGVSGSGKSTLLKLLMRFYDVDDGKITIDGQDIADVTQVSLRESIAYVPQEPLLFHRSIKENIAYARPEATLNEVIAAAKSANALEFIEKLPKKFDTLVGERGVKLSGGQRQRIAIARAILKDAPILILDEATSALDSESEALIQDALTHLMKNRTTIVIAHRLSTIAKLDRIIVLKDGSIVEDGTHQKLQSGSGVYSKLWARQSGGFINTKD